MIPVKDQVTITDFMDGEKTVMTVRPEDWKKLSGLLINLYSDTILACIREYSTNALDTHIEMGVTDPIEVVTPNAFSNILTIKDKGRGMDKYDLQNTYAMFGASTKDESNDFNGSMGLGSKSALTYTDSFTIISVKNGIQTSAMVGRDDEGNGIMEILGECETNEPNGTTIQIPAKTGDEYQFRLKANEFFQYWKPGTVLLNGQEPEKFDPESLGYVQVTSDVWVKPQAYSHISTVSILMENVVYDHSMNINQDLMRGLKIYHEADNGTIQFSPSRESLMMNRTTTTYVEELFKFAEKRYIESISKTISNQPTLAKAIAKFEEFESILTQGSVKWRGIPVRKSIYYGGREYRPNSDSGSACDNINLAHVLRNQSKYAVLKNYQGTNLTRAQKNALVDYFEENSLNYTAVIYNGQDSDGYLSSLPTIDWEKVKPYIKKTDRGSAKNETFPIAYWDSTLGRFVDEVSTLPDNRKILYASPVSMRTYSGSPYPISWLKSMPNAVLVYLNYNRHDKFAREHPDASPVFTYVEEWIKKIVESLTDEEKEASRTSHKYLFDYFNGKTNDKYIDSVADAVVSYVKKEKQVQEVASPLRRMNLGDRVRHLDADVSTVGNYFEEKYPLLNNYNFRHSHAIEYINAIYEKDKESK